jgi:mannose-6-phosphate isomerase-like protein (cupin superfamily)
MTILKANLAALLGDLSCRVSVKWPMDERVAHAFSHGSMTVELYAPTEHDPQTPHDQDELYFIMRGASEFVLENRRTHLCAGDVVFVPAGASHRFENFSEDFATWVVFYGEHGGER